MKQATLTKPATVTVELPAGATVFVKRSDKYGTWFTTRAAVGGFVPNTMITIAGKTIADRLAEEEAAAPLCSAPQPCCPCGKSHQLGQ